MVKTIVPSPLGDLVLLSRGTSLCGLYFQDSLDKKTSLLLQEAAEENLPVFEAARKWLSLYFSGTAPSFTPALSPEGSPFQLRVWQILLQIPYGKTLSYGEIARQIAAERGIPRMAAQAVGGAAHRNPISLIIPCHRVIGSHGSLTGYGGGLSKKRYLLEKEGIELEKEGIAATFDQNISAGI